MAVVQQPMCISNHRWITSGDTLCIKLFMRVDDHTIRYSISVSCQWPKQNLLISIGKCVYEEQVYRLFGQWQQTESSDCCYSSVYLTLKSELKIPFWEPHKTFICIYLFALLCIVNFSIELIAVRFIFETRIEILKLHLRFSLSSISL